MLPPVPSVGISVNIYPFWLPPNSILLRSGPCEFLLERHPWISRMGTCSRGEPHTCDDHVAPEWSVKFSIASSCTWSLSVSSNSCLKTLITLNFLQSIWKLLQENSELENFPEIFQPLLSSTKEEAACGLTGHFGLTRSLSFMLCSSVGFFLRIMNSKGHYFHSFGQDNPLSSPYTWPHPQDLFLSWDFQNKPTMPSLFSDAQGVMVWSNNSPSFWNVVGGISLEF